jgi:flagellar protein FlgJ
MNLPGIVQNVLAGATAQAPQNDKLHKAAQQFEALLISQMLKTAHTSDGSGWLGESDSAGSDSATEMAESQLADALASGKGIGLASLVERSMSGRVNQNVAETPAYSAGSLKKP